jgi:hypothetical protein
MHAQEITLVCPPRMYRFYMRCPSNFPRDNRHMPTDWVNKQATKDG